MIKTLIFIFIAIAISLGLGWLLDNNGSVVINWLGYEISTDVFTVFLATTAFVLLIFVFSYVLISLSSLRIFNKNKAKNCKNDKQ